MQQLSVIELCSSTITKKTTYQEFNQLLTAVQAFIKKNPKVTITNISVINQDKEAIGTHTQQLLDNSSKNNKLRISYNIDSNQKILKFEIKRFC